MLSAAPSSIQLQALLKRFVSAYQEGDLDKFLALFSPDVSTSDYAGKPALRQDYAQFFSSTQARELQLKALKWRIEGGTAQGKDAISFRFLKAAVSLKIGAGFTFKCKTGGAST